MFENAGVAASAGVAAALIGGVSITLTAIVHWRGPQFRKSGNEEDVAAHEGENSKA